MAFLAIFGLAAVIYVLSLAVGAAVRRWSDASGVDPEPRISQRRLAVALACLIFAPALGASLALIHVGLLALTVPIGIGGLVAGIMIMQRGEKHAPPPPPEYTGPGHAGLAYFWHCWVPQRLHTGTRAMVAALIGPPLAIVFVVLENWALVAVFGGFSVLSSILLVTVKPRVHPKRGPCLRAE